MRVSYYITLVLFLVITLAVSCDDSSETEPAPDGDMEQETEQEAEIGEGIPPLPDYAPSFLLKPEDKERILSRIDREPYITVLAHIRSIAQREHRDLPEGVFDSEEQANGVVAQMAAFLAWLEGDEAMAQKARDFFKQLSDDYATHEDGDLNIRMPSIFICYVFALDLLRAAEMIPEDEAMEMENKLRTIASAFYDEYLEDTLARIVALWYSQNNHPIRTACSIAIAAMAFPDHPKAKLWANFAFSELHYLWGPEGQYVAEDGGVCEGSLYYRFGFAPSLAVALAYRNRIGEPRIFEEDCINRQDEGHWADYDCQQGRPFVFENLLNMERFLKSQDWFLSLRMPDGYRPSMEDSARRRGNGSPIMAGILDRPDFLWDWYHDDMNMGGGFDLSIQVLAYMPDDMEPQEPEYTHRVMPIAGQAVMRSGWGEDSLYAMMTAEHGSSRLTLHDHIDGGSFVLYAYNDYLLIDSGYYKPNMASNAITAQYENHNVLMIEGEDMPPKGLLLNYGGVDAFLKNEFLEQKLAYVESWQTIDQSTLQRAMMMLHDRYVVIMDRVETPVTVPRKHTWRLHGHAGFDSGGEFSMDGSTARWQRDNGGVDMYLASSAEGLTLVRPERNGEHVSPHAHNIMSDPEDHEIVDGEVTAVAPLFVAVLAPFRVGADGDSPEAPLTVEAVTVNDVASGIAAWKVSHSKGSDMVMVREGTAPETFTLSTGQQIDTDAQFIVFSIEGDEPLSMIARGTRLSVDDAVLFENIDTDAAWEVQQAQ